MKPETLGTGTQYTGTAYQIDLHNVSARSMTAHSSCSKLIMIDADGGPATLNAILNVGDIVCSSSKILGHHTTNSTELLADHDGLPAAH